MDGFLQKFQAANILPKAESEEFFARYAEVSAVYPHDDAEMVSSHNDVSKPDNILFDGQRVWLVDWEAAFLNDRYADLAAVANQVVANDEEEMVFLQKYFGAAPDECQLARFHLMRQIAHLFYTMAFLFLGSSGKPIDWSGTVPEFRDYHRRMWAGEVDLADKDVKIVYGRFIGNGSYKTCGKHDTTKHSELFQIGMQPHNVSWAQLPSGASLAHNRRTRNLSLDLAACGPGRVGDE